MPKIDLIQVPLYGPNDPYHFQYDNAPLEAILQRQELINLALDNVIEQMTDAIGTQGTVANRLNQSINSDGSLKASAINAAQHSIADHVDDATYVRMLKTESDKLALVADNATSLYLQVQTDPQGDLTVLNSGPAIIAPSSTITWSVQSPNKIVANMAFPVSAAHSHYYDQIPVAANQTNPDYINYKVNSTSSAYIAGSLRVYINGVRLTARTSLYVPGALVNDPWTLMTFTPNPTAGTFALSTAISSDDVIIIDYDLSFT